MALPILLCLQSANNNKYLRNESENDGLLRFSVETGMEPSAQFQVEKARNWPDLVHIKSRYTNRYLVRKSANEQWIVAGSEAPAEQDLTDWSCTLFRSFAVAGAPNKTRLLHVQQQRYLRLAKGVDDEQFESCLLAQSNQAVDGQDSVDVFTVLDMESVLKLPKHVAFKGGNGMYLGLARRKSGRTGLQFSYNDPSDPNVKQEIFSSPNYDDGIGTISIKSSQNGKFWAIDGNSTDPSWIDVAGEDPSGTNNASGLFALFVLATNKVALRNMGNNLFAKRYTNIENENFLGAFVAFVDDWTPLEIVDLDN